MTTNWRTVYEGPSNAAAGAELSGRWGESVQIRVSDTHKGDVRVSAGGSLAEAWAMLRPGGRLLLERGGVWTEPIPRLNISGVTIGAWGDGAPPIIEATFPIRGAPGAEPLDGITIRDLHLRAPAGWDGVGGDCVGIWFQRTGTGLTIENCRIEGFANNIVIEGMVEHGRKDVRVLNCIVADPHRTDSGNANIFVSGVDGLLIEGCAIVNTLANDARGNLHSHGLYLSQANTPGTATVRGNLVYNARTGVTMRGGGVIENNLVIRCGQGITSSASTLGEAGARIVGNVVTESRNHWNGQLLGLGIETRGIDADIMDNIVFGATDGSSHIGITLAGGGGEIAGNTVFAWSRDGEGLLSPALVVRARGPIVVSANRLVQTRDQFVTWDRTPTLDGGRVTYTGNAYHTPRGQQFFIDEDRRGWMFDPWRETREPDAEWFEAAPSEWPVSLADVLGMETPAWIDARVSAWDAGVVGEVIRRVEGAFE